LLLSRRAFFSRCPMKVYRMIRQSEGYVANCLKYSFLKGKEDFSLLTMNTEAIQPIQITFAS